jgi:hypothetical protein
MADHRKNEFPTDEPLRSDHKDRTPTLRISRPAALTDCHFYCRSASQSIIRTRIDLLLCMCLAVRRLKGPGQDSILETRCMAHGPMKRAAARAGRRHPACFRRLTTPAAPRLCTGWPPEHAAHNALQLHEFARPPINVSGDGKATRSSRPTSRSRQESKAPCPACNTVAVSHARHRSVTLPRVTSPAVLKSSLRRITP